VKTRVIYIDWIRVLAIVLVVYIHCINVAGNFLDLRGWGENKHQLKEKRDGIIRSLVQIGIPIFFYISGISTVFYNADKKGFCTYLKQKFLRLLLPFFVAFFVFLIPRHYLMQDIDTDFARIDGVSEWNYFLFVKKFLPGITKISWLWFLIALFIDSIINYPLLKFVQRRKAKEPVTLNNDGLTLFGFLFLIGGFYGVQYLAVRKDNNEYIECAWLTFILVCCHCTFALVPMFLANSEERGKKYGLMTKLIGPFFICMLNFAKDGTNNTTMYGFMAQLTYDIVFMSQGMIDQLYRKEQEESRAKMANTMWTPFAIVSFFLVYSLCTPTNVSTQGYLFFYPLYDLTTLQHFHTIGTWMAIYLTDYHMAIIANQVFDQKWYELIIGCSYYLFLSHYFWITVFAKLFLTYVVLGFAANVALSLLFTLLICMLTYIGLVKCYTRMCGKKKNTT
jgi:peptidoglycan/LPS O-acetylase OafA/YrhL